MTGGHFGCVDLCITIALLEIAHAFKPEQIVRRGPGSDPQCMSPLISAQDEFPDSAFSASSVLLNKTDFQPYQARLIEVYGSREHTSGYAWCPASPVGEMLQDWIQAEFPDLVMIKSIFTAGRGDGNVKEFMPSFVLRYQRQDGGTWYEHVKRDGARVLLANSDPRNLARATLDSMVIAKRVRLYPYSRTSNQNVCLRFALYGCKFPDGVVSYSMPQGGLGLTRASYHSVSRGDALEDNNVVRQLKDLFYDGQIVGTTYQQLTDGLGQLMDNVAFLGNLTRESDVYPSQPGFHFVGWHQAEHSEVQILFEFDTARRFTWIRLFTYDSIQLRVRLFSRATVAFSSDGVRFEDTLEFTTGRVHFYDSRSRTLSRPQRSPTSGPGDSKRTRQSTISQPEVRIYADPEYGGAVVVEMDLIKRVAKYIRLTIIPTDNWFVLSEIQFNSTVAAPSKSSLHTQTSSLQSDRNTSNQLSRNLKNKPVDLSSNIGAQSGASPGAQGSTNGRARETATVINNRPKHQSSPSASAKQTGSLVADSANFINDLIPSNEKFVTVLPIIITIAFLLLLLPTVLLVWLCTRKHRKRTRLLCLSKHSAADGDRGGFHSHGRLGTGDLFTLGPNPALSTQEAAKLLAPYQQITAKPHPDGTFATAGPFCINNGNHLIHRIGDGTVIGSTTVGNMGQTVQYTSSHQPSGTGVLMTYSPDSSGSGTDRNAPFPVVSTLTQSMALNNCAQAPVEPTLYSQTDGNCINGPPLLRNDESTRQLYLPAFIMLPAGPSKGSIIFQQVSYSHVPVTAVAGPHIPTGLSQLGTPDSGSLYTSIRNSIAPPSLSTFNGVESDVRQMSQVRSEMEYKPEQTRSGPVEEIPVSNPVAPEHVERLQEDVVTSEPNSGEEIHLEIDNTTRPAGYDPASTEADGRSDASEILPVYSAHVDDRGTSVGIITAPVCHSSAMLPGNTESNGQRSIASLPDGVESISFHADRMPLNNRSSVFVPHPSQLNLVFQPYGPEYASASIFSFTPPPSEPPNTDPPNTCSEATQAVTLHQSVPTYTVSFAHPCSGPNNVYAGPASMPVDLATLRIQSRQVPSGQLQTTVSPQTPGLLLLPQYPFGRVNGDDSQALYQSISSNPYVFPPEAGHPCNMYSPDHQTTSQQHVNGYTNRITMGTEVNNGWVPSTTKRLSATPQDMDPKQTSWGPEVPWGASANAYLLSNPIHLNVLPHSHASEMLAFTQSGSQIPPQHYIPTHLVFPMLSTQQPSNPLVENIHDCNARQIDSNFRRASSVGATKGPVGYPALSHENCIRDGPGSGRLSIYSVCT
ncbi:unnamed protein product [Dicrocoelium dendriticum]|nr:unnamed protein product [Dicrocoelium dendriticum]